MRGFFSRGMVRFPTTRPANGFGPQFRMLLPAKEMPGGQRGGKLAAMEVELFRIPAPAVQQYPNYLKCALFERFPSEAVVLASNSRQISRDAILAR